MSIYDVTKTQYLVSKHIKMEKNNIHVSTGTGKNFARRDFLDDLFYLQTNFSATPAKY